MSTLLILLLLLLGIILVVFLIFNSIGFFVGGPYASTPSKAIRKLFDTVHVDEKDTVYDLGSGDGRILIAAAKRGAKAIGWEINYPLYIYSKRLIRKLKLKSKITIKYGNFWKADFSKPTVIFAFILPNYMTRLENKLEREAKPGTWVITYLAKLPSRKPVKTTSEGLSIYQF